MRIWQAIHSKLNATSAVTNITGPRIYHGVRPSTDTGNYVINYFQVAGEDIVLDTGGEVENPVYQISCRATTPANAEELALIVSETLQNMKEDAGGFSINFVNLMPGGELIEEEDGEWYHVPLTMRFVFFNSEND